MKQELVGMMNFNVVGGQARPRKVFKVERDNRVCTGMDGCRDDVTVPIIGKVDAGDKMFVSIDLRAQDGGIHQSAGTSKLFRLNV